jgi:hypothetical protein
MNKSIVYEQINETVAEMNMKSELQIALLTLVSEVESLAFFDVERTIEQIRRTPHNEQVPNIFDIEGDGGKIVGSGAVLPFPWDSDNLRITTLSWNTRGSHHVFGIDVGDTLESADEILLEFGYIKRDLSNSPTQTEWYIERFGRMTIYDKSYMSIVFITFENDSDINEIRLIVDDPFRGPPTHSEEGVEGVDWVS